MYPEVQARLEEIRGEQTGFPVGTSAIAARANVTAESLMDQAETILARAMEAGQLSAAVSTLKEKGVLSGKRIERSEIGQHGEFDNLSDDELKRMIVERFVRLGLVPGLAISDGAVTLNGRALPFRSDDE